jgi:hypothetical protein
MVIWPVQAQVLSLAKFKTLPNLVIYIASFTFLKKGCFIVLSEKIAIPLKSQRPLPHARRYGLERWWTRIEYLEKGV